jgi:hypothetical protein
MPHQKSDFGSRKVVLRKGQAHENMGRHVNVLAAPIFLHSFGWAKVSLEIVVFLRACQNLGRIEEPIEELSRSFLFSLRETSVSD